MIKEATAKLINSTDLSYEEAKDVMTEIMSGNATPSQISAFLTSLRIKGENIDEITACAEVMRNKAARINAPFDVLDIVGTGGDNSGTFNISTTSSFVIAAAGIPVAKHGNRSASSKSGAADVLESLGVNINITPEQNEKILKEHKICFMFANLYHSSMKYAAPVRKEIGIRTVFNVLGPLTNPAFASTNIIGVYDKKLVEPLAKVLSNLGTKRGFTLYGDGLDEATVCGKTTLCEINNGTFKSFEISPEDVGLKTYPFDDIKGGTPEKNAKITLDILSGKETGAKLDIVLLNSALAIYAAGKADSIKDGVEKARNIISDGLALKKLEEFKSATNNI